MSGLLRELTKGLFVENPTFRILLGLCPTLAVTTAASNGVSMGLATTAVLLGSNVAIASLRKVIPDEVRIPAYIVLIASFVTIVDLSMNAWAHAAYKTLGIFIPLIVVNCIIMGRAEAFASRNGVMASLLDAVGMGVGFTMSLTLIASLREIFGNGTWFGMTVLPESLPDVLVVILPPGGFIVMGLLLALFSSLQRQK